MSYRRDPIKAPVLSGVPLRAFVAAVESPVGPVLLKKLMTDSGFDRFLEADAGRATPIQVPLPHPKAPSALPASREELAEQALALPSSSKGPALETVAAYREAYAEGRTDPTRVVQRLHEHITSLEGGDQLMNFFISRKPEEVLAAAQASAERHAKGAPRSVLDGVPVVVKDEVDMEGFATTLGTSFLKTPAAADSTVVARLKAAGAIILGKANMNEVGINPIGMNPHWGPARNPFDRHHITGGSSSASASTVAAGLAPVSIGADGGGSIRIPAALCGVVGLKSTWGRISEHGVPPLCWNVGHVGPLGLTVADVAAAWALLAGPDPKDPSSLAQPPPHLEGLGETSLAGVRLGICTPYFEDADRDVVARCREAVRALTDAGATVVEVPAQDLNVVLWSLTTIILSEMRAGLGRHVAEDTTRFALDTRTNLAIAGQFRSTDLLHAMRHRQRITEELLGVLKDVDCMVTPTTAITAPPIPEHTLPDGESNLPVTDPLMRFVRQGNITGFPALSVPAGYDSKGLPVGLQLMGRPWEEAFLLRLGRVVEASVERRLPRVHVTALG